MGIRIPIVTEFDGRAIARARKEFAQLETAGEKAQFAIRKAAVPAAAALTAVGVALFDATKGAVEDAAAQDALANNLRRTTKATDAQIAATEDWITTQGQLFGVTDSELRPALARLARATGSVTKAQQLVSQAMDLSAATGRPLENVVQALQRAYGGNFKALQTLAPEYRQLIKDGATFEEVMGKLAATTGGAAANAANTAQGRFKRLQVAMDETKESVGAALLPVIEAALPVLQKFADWAGKNPDAFLAIAAAITAVSVAIMAVNLAMALNPFTAIAAGIALLVTGVVLAYRRFEKFRDVVRTVVNGIASYFEFMVNAWIKAINVVIRGINLVKPGNDIAYLGPVTIGRMRSGDSGFDTSGMSESRIVDFVPAELSAGARSMRSGVNITVNAGVGDPVAIGREVASVMSAYDRRIGAR